MIDQTNAILTKSLRSIEKGLGKVAKKKFKDDPEVGLLGNKIIITIPKGSYGKLQNSAVAEMLIKIVEIQEILNNLLAHLFKVELCQFIHQKHWKKMPKNQPMYLSILFLKHVLSLLHNLVLPPYIWKVLPRRACFYLPVFQPTKRKQCVVPENLYTSPKNGIFL